MTNLYGHYQNASIKCLEVSRVSLSGFRAQIGKNYTKGLLVIGRATNGWMDEDDSIGPGKENCIEAFVSKTLIRSNECADMDWLCNEIGENGYNPNRSAFWRVIHAALVQMNADTADDSCWASKLAWTNLYKLAPVGGGNPTQRLRTAQFDDCVEILKLEIDNLDPTDIIFLTGGDWVAPFFDRIWQIQVQKNTGLIDWWGRIGRSRVVVAKHPQGKNESAWVDAARGALNNAS